MPTRIGWTEVEHVRAMTRAVAMSENLFGGGLSCDVAAAQLRWAGQLVEAQAADDVHRAVAEAGSCVVSVGAFGAAARPAGPSLAGQGRLRRCYAMAHAPPWTCEPPRPLRAALRAGRGLPSTTRGTAGAPR